ncbi:probable phospholipid-transporting ATPase 4 [Tanacetum coccineum]
MSGVATLPMQPAFSHLSYSTLQRAFQASSPTILHRSALSTPGSSGPSTPAMRAWPTILALISLPSTPTDVEEEDKWGGLFHALRNSPEISKYAPSTSRAVAECMDKLAQSRIKIWLLTRDKKETAVNIGFACSLLRHDMQQFHLSLSRDAESKNQLEEAMKDDILNQIEASVYRKQKALITLLVKRYTGKMTLAIGNGANDVGMIQEAGIGIGISGMEGMQQEVLHIQFTSVKSEAISIHFA